jgi:4-aminobutyrate aminotransferase-like enzyme
MEGNAFRIAPALTVNAAEIDEALAILRESFEAAGAN